MAISDMFNASKIKEESSRLKAENEQLRQLVTPEMQNAITLQNHIADLKNQELNLNNSIASKSAELQGLFSTIDAKRSQLVMLDDDLLFQEFALYKPHYDFCNSDEYSEKLKAIRDQQKQLIKSNSAVSGNMGWTLNGNTTQGNKMVKDMQKLLLRAFNSECDETISKVKYNNIELSEKRIRTSCDAISRLGSMMHIVITQPYFNSKMEELHLAFEYQQKKQEEKETAKEARAEMKEAAKLQKEIEEQRKKIEKEQTHYENALQQVIKQLENESSPDLLQKKEELENQLSDIKHSLEDIDYREANQRAGYVYIISNIGAFGENIYKIGMTRRLDPQDRIDELGDASVPFNFDVHAMIFSDDAPALETALHNAFESKKVNMINQRREFFHVTLDEIKSVVKENYDKTVEFIEYPDAEQYRESLKLRTQE